MSKYPAAALHWPLNLLCGCDAALRPIDVATVPGGWLVELSRRAIEATLTNLKPLRDLAQNWDINIATW